ncbi:MAG TPA: hypothetical protein PK736_07045, partial [Bacteroidia bacterium]|nr:hypothetical protein [Bacteroidia bacterium]
PIVSKVDIEPMQAKVIYYNYKTGYGNGEYDFAISATANGMSDAMEQKIKVSPKGFPVQQSFSSNQMHDKFTTSLNDVVPGSVDVTLTAYPNIVSDLLKGVDAILREPYGCFEQTSMSSYPNVLVMEYLKTSGQEDPKIMAQAEKLIDKGYKMLTKYEASQRGYEWFGSNPGHEALTAYGLMQFNDMKSVYPNLDEKMIKRTADWLTARKDGKGGFLRDGKALDSYGRASEDVTNAYITYALSAAQTPNLEKEIDYSFDKAEASGDAYMLALSANSLFDHNRDRRGEKIVKELLKMQNENGSWTGKSHSITYSTGNALTVETTSIALMALLKSENVPFEQVNSAANYIVKARNGAGDFGNTQSTIMALKALTAYAKY